MITSDNAKLISELKEYQYAMNKKNNKKAFRLPSWVPEISLNVAMPPILTIRTAFLVKNFGRMSQDIIGLHVAIFKWEWSFDVFCREAKVNDGYYSERNGYAQTYAASSTTPAPF